MNRRNLVNAIVIIAVLASIIIMLGVARWLLNGGWPSTGPTGDTLPPNMQKVNPFDGETVTETNSVCVYFDFRAGQGMGSDPEKTIRFFYNGYNVTNKVDGLIALNQPPSLGVLCYKPGRPLLSGWHTFKVTYKDIANKSFSYIWRFQVTGK